MNSVLELYDSRVSHIYRDGGEAVINFSHAYIIRYRGKPGEDPCSGWSQEAELILEDAIISDPLPPLPNTILDGFLQVGGVKHELIPIPFKRKVWGILKLTFVDGTTIEIIGKKPILELFGKPIKLEDFP